MLNDTGWIELWIFVATVYVPATVFLRSRRLAGACKWIFSLTVVPVVALLTACNIVLGDLVFGDLLNRPPLSEWLSAKQKITLAVVALPVLGGGLWYALFVRLTLCYSRARAHIRPDPPPGP